MTDWVEVGSIATFCAASVSAAAAAVVARQTYWTRRATQAAEAALATARETLNVGQQSISVSRDLAIEGIKARLDVRAPHVAVRGVTTSWPPYEMESYGEPQPFQRGTSWRMTQHQAKRIGVRVSGEIANEGDRSVEITFKNVRPGGLGEWWVPCPAEGLRLVLNAGQTTTFTMLYFHTLTQWIENWQAAASAFPNVALGEISVSDGRDEGIADRWTIVSTGRAVQPVQDDIAGWLLFGDTMQQMPSVRDSDGIESYVTDARRTYYLSKQGNLELPAISSTTQA